MRNVIRARNGKTDAQQIYILILYVCMILCNAQYHKDIVNLRYNTI